MEWLGAFIQKDPNTAAAIALIVLGLFWIMLRRQTRQSGPRRYTIDRDKDPNELPDLSPSLKRARIQIVMALVGIAAFTFIGIMGLLQ